MFGDPERRHETEITIQGLKQVFIFCSVAACIVSTSDQVGIGCIKATENIVLLCFQIDIISLWAMLLKIIVATPPHVTDNFNYLLYSMY